MFMADAYRDMIAVEGEIFAITASDASESTTMRGMYDRRTLVGEVAGAETRAPEYQVGVADSQLPAWVGPGARIDIRADTLQVTALEPDGQGLTLLVCRAAE